MDMEFISSLISKARGLLRAEISRTIWNTFHAADVSVRYNSKLHLDRLEQLNKALREAVDMCD